MVADEVSDTLFHLSPELLSELRVELCWVILEIRRVQLLVEAVTSSSEFVLFVQQRVVGFVDFLELFGGTDSCAGFVWMVSQRFLCEQASPF